MAAKAIMKSRMPRLDPTKKVVGYMAMYKCIGWLKGLKDWESEMEKIDAKVCAKVRASHDCLF